MITWEANKLKNFIEHNVEIWNIQQISARQLFHTLSVNDINEHYAKIDKEIKEDIEWISYDDLWEFLHEYHIYQENIDKNQWVQKLEKSSFRVEDINSRKESITADGIDILENKQWADRDIIEFKSWQFEGKQLFKPKALLRELAKVNKTLPASPEVYEKIIKEKYNWDYGAFFKGESLEEALSSCLSVSDDTIPSIGTEYYLLCANWEYYWGNKDFWHKRESWDYYVSARCIQQ